MSGHDTDDGGDDKTYDVGYGKPPEATRFKAGQSGNPKGRPKGSRNTPKAHATIENLKALAIEEAYRPIQIRDGGEIKEMPAIRAALRSLSLQAAQGKQGAQRKLFELVQEVEVERMKKQEELFAALVEYKRDAQERIELARRLGHKEPDILPHPDDLVIDPLAGSVISKGPWTKEEKDELDDIRTMKSGLEKELQLKESQPDHQMDTERIAALKAVIERFDRVLNYPRVILSPRAMDHL